MEILVASSEACMMWSKARCSAVARSVLGRSRGAHHRVRFDAQHWTPVVAIIETLCFF